MQDIEILDIKLEEVLNIGELSLDVEKIYPKLEDIEITPSTIDKVYKSENHYGYNEVKVKGTAGVAEDLNVELTEQDNLLTTQEVAIENIITALEGKSAGGGGITPSVEGNTLILSHANVEGGVLSI